MKPTIALVLISLWAQPTSITLLTFESYFNHLLADTQY